MTTEEFIIKARAIHGDKYDYSKVEYVGHDEKVCIICPKHGNFYKTFHNHLRGQGCPFCKQEERKVSFSFIEKAKAVHGQKYIYDKVEYVNARTNVCIICPKHGEFWQNPGAHLRGSECPICMGRKPYGTAEFVKRARLVHGNKYDYSKVEYKKQDEKVCIICPKHGQFWQVAYAHLHGSQCPQCAKENIHKESKYNTETFINEAKKIHGDFYNYEKTNYVNMTTKLCVTCPVHGDFWVLPYVHLKGHKCRQCAPLTNRKYTREECIQKALLCESRHEFEIKYRGYYGSAKTNGWYEDCVAHMAPKGIKERRCIYVYKFENIDGKSYAYVGLTYNIEVRDRRHHKEGSVYNFAKEHNISIPTPVLMTDYLEEQEASVQEGVWLDYFKQQGYIALNRIKTGSLGGQDLKDYSLSTIRTSLEKSESFTQWREQYGAYNDYLRHKKMTYIIDEYFPDRMQRIYDNFDECYNAYSKCHSLEEVKRIYPGAMAAAKRHGWHQQLSTLCKNSRIIWTKEKCTQLVSQYNELLDFRKENPIAYQIIRKNKWQDILTPLHRQLHKRYTFTIEEIKNICSKYTSRVELKKNHPEIIGYCDHHKIDLFRLNGWKYTNKKGVRLIQEGRVVAEFETQKGACLFASVDYRRIGRYLNKGKVYHGYIWESI